jgi:predicted GTPase
LDLEELAKEDAEGEFEGVTFIVEVLDEEGNVLPPELAAARSLKQPERKKSVVDVFNSLDINSENKQEEETYEADEEPPVCVTYETNGSVNPHRIIVRLSDESQQEEGFAINVGRTGKVTVGDDENDREERRSRNVRRRR